MVKVPACLTAQASWDGVQEALGWTDGHLIRPGAHWLVAREGQTVVTRRISPEPSQVFADLATWPDPDPDYHGYASPAGDGLVLCTRQEIISLGPTGTPRWSSPYQPWDEDSSALGAVATTRCGDDVIAVIPEPLEADGSYRGDLCIALDAACGTVTGRQVLDCASAVYEIHQPLAGEDVLFLSAGQGQDRTLSLLVAIRAGELSVAPVGGEDEPITGISPDGQSLVTTERGGAYLRRYATQAAAPGSPLAEVQVSATGAGEDNRFVCRPGFVDASTILAPVAEEWWAEDCRHFLLDGSTLRVTAEVDYLFPANADPLPLGDGTWLTTSATEVFRWTLTATAGPPRPACPEAARDPLLRHAGTPLPPAGAAQPMNRTTPQHPADAEALFPSLAAPPPHLHPAAPPPRHPQRRAQLGRRPPAAAGRRTLAGLPTSPPARHRPTTGQHP